MTYKLLWTTAQGFHHIVGDCPTQLLLIGRLKVYPVAVAGMDHFSDSKEMTPMLTSCPLKCHVEGASRIGGVDFENKPH
jgi:hypothetical protein